MSSKLICEKSDFLECHAAVLLWKMFLPVFFLVGVPGNILSIVVLSRKRMRDSTTSVYLRLLAIIDTIVLLIAVPREILYYYAFIMVDRLSSFTCKFYAFLHPGFIAISWCILPVITLDRCIHVKYPVWAKEHCSKKSAVIIFLVLAATVLAINCHRVVLHDTQEKRISSNSTKVKVVCAATNEWYAQFKAETWPLIFSLSFSVTPVVCQILGNVLLVRELAFRSHQKKARKVLEAGHKKEKQDLKSITKMLLTVCVFFVLSSFPQCTQIVIDRYIFDQDVPHDVAKRLLFQCIVQIMVYSNISINFLLYTFSAQIFRKELCTIFLHARRPVLKWLGRSVHPVDTTYDQELPDGTRKGKITSQRAECSHKTKTVQIGQY